MKEIFRSMVIQQIVVTETFQFSSIILM